MRYLPTIDLWLPGMCEALRNGQLRLQRGQWVRCGNEKLSRFVSASKATIWAIHYSPAQAGQFRSACSIINKAKTSN